MTPTGPSRPQAAIQSPRLDRSRYWRMVRFFGSIIVSLIWWDAILRQVPGARGVAQRSALQRWRRLARRFRELAVSMGGVLIKLGQFLSIRVDVLPPEVTAELADLQDEVTAEALADIQAVIAAEFGRPAGQVFEWFAPYPEAAASLAQVHRARLAVPGPGTPGQEVAVKIQRPRIEMVVETDLAALGTAIRWLKWYPPVARRVNLDRFFEEFATTTRRELDFVSEGRHAERFASDFADDSGIVVPRIYWDYTTRRVLTMENVASIKITDLAGMQAAGISRAQVASRLYHAYLRQVFVTNFVHADPHPGNLFVRPLPSAAEEEPGASRPFRLVFVDFGMMAVIPERLRAQMRELLIGMGTRDSYRVVQVYQDAGILLPGADRKRLEEMHDVLFERMQGIKLGELRQVAFEQAQFLWREYRDIMYEMPFQFPADVLFVGRAMGILSGIATSLNPEFDPWAETVPFAEQLAGEEMARQWRGWFGELGHLARLMFALPGRLDRFLVQGERGRLTLQTALAPDTAQILRRLERSVDRLTWGVIFASLLIAASILRVVEGPGPVSSLLLVGAALALVIGLTRR